MDGGTTKRDERRVTLYFSAARKGFRDFCDQAAFDFRDVLRACGKNSVTLSHALKFSFDNQARSEGRQRV